MAPGRRLVIWVSARMYALLLWAYPATHRREYGAQMEQLFRDLCRDSHREQGTIGIVRLWGRVLRDTFVAAAIEYWDLLQEGGGFMTRKQHWMILSSAGLPLVLGLMLFVINPAFMGHLVKPGPAQPAGWLMAAAVLIQAGGAYLLQRKIIVWAASADASGRIAIRQRFFLVCSGLFLVLPALLLVLFGPAIMMLMGANRIP
ncbi:MAG: hypothetical protein JXB38_21825 [Anaerolineales bacterium]|nr:hypothetical protein [Anaerolineales bacterium]